ncbi:MAG: S8 family serine peptidase [Prevotellaceae bacterium]|nr:S8 family serine peptidase [Prevotellaceae bacterium]
MKTIWLILLSLLSASGISAQGGVARARTDTLKYRITLSDKRATPYSIYSPQAFLSERAIERRNRQHLPIDSTDLPVCQTYIDDIRRQGVHIVLTGKWENFVTVSCNDTTAVQRIRSLPFVRSAKQVWRKPADSNHPIPRTRRDTAIYSPTFYPDSVYGRAGDQLRMSRGDWLHNAGFRGKGMTIAVIDAGFRNVNRIESMHNIRILGTHNFVTPSVSVFNADSHGTSVLSCIGMNTPGIMTGTAPDADFWLLCSEDIQSEYPVEQDYWAAAVEFADSVGADMVNSSLGYYAFDDSTANITYRQLDGRSTLISRQASHMANKGIVLVCSAGNTGSGSWKKIAPPADADHVLTVGAIDRRGMLAHFSSIGNTADGRIKPDVVAIGRSAEVMDANGSQRHADGTSFAAPILCGMVACLWQALPSLTAKELIALVRRLGNRVDAPDNIYGYGIPDLSQPLRNRLQH